MKLDLTRDRREIRKYIQQRVRDYPEYVNLGPGEDEDPITQITLGYQYDQSGWVALVFDTRPDAKFDGEWTLHLDENMLELPHWFSALHGLSENGTPVTCALPGGKNNIIDEYDDSVISPCLGEMLRGVLLDVRKKGVLAELPLAEDCTLAIEDFNGAYGWRDPDDSPKYESQLDEDIACLVPTMQEADQIDYLTKRLDRMAAGKDCDMEYFYLEVSRVYDYLGTLGDKPVIPLLKLARKWANKPEWDGDRPSRKIEERPMQDVVIHALRLGRDSGCANKEVEKLLREILRKSVKANEHRRLWGIIPYHAAVCLHTLFDNYAEPQMGYCDNSLASPDQFIGTR